MLSESRCSITYQKFVTGESLRRVKREGRKRFDRHSVVYFIVTHLQSQQVQQRLHVVLTQPAMLNSESTLSVKTTILTAISGTLLSFFFFVEFSRSFLQSRTGATQTKKLFSMTYEKFQKYLSDFCTSKQDKYKSWLYVCYPTGAWIVKEINK